MTFQHFPKNIKRWFNFNILILSCLFPNLLSNRGEKSPSITSIQQYHWQTAFSVLPLKKKSVSITANLFDKLMHIYSTVNLRKADLEDSIRMLYCPHGTGKSSVLGKIFANFLQSATRYNIKTDVMKTS